MKTDEMLISLIRVKWRMRYIQSVAIDEIEAVIKDLSKGKSYGIDSVAAKLLQCMGATGREIITNLMNKIYKSGYISEDFRESIFVSIPKVGKAQECSDFRAISLISCVSKVSLHLI